MDKEKAFTQIIKENEGVIYKIARVYTHNETSQKDLYQEIVYQLWKSFGKFREEAKISTWMYRIALNTALFHSKQEKKRGTKVTLDGIPLKQENYDPVWEERLTILYNHIKALNDLDKAIIVLFLEGWRHSEIAGIIGISESNVGTRIARIKEKLKTQIIKNR